MKTRTALIGLALALAASSVFAQAVPTRVRGTIQSFDGKQITIAAADGSSVSLAVSPMTPVVYSVPKKLSDIKGGDFVATGGVTGKDGRIHANEVRIFPASMKGLGEGQYPMQAPGSSMTNATILTTDGTVTMANGGGTMKMSFTGTATDANGKCTGHAPPKGTAGCTGTTEVDVAAGVPIHEVVMGDQTLLKPGLAVSTFTATGPDGKPMARLLSVEKDGVKPAM